MLRQLLENRFPCTLTYACLPGATWLQRVIEKNSHAGMAFLPGLLLLAASSLPADAATFTQSGSVRSIADTDDKVETITTKSARALGPRVANWDGEDSPVQPFLHDSTTLNLEYFNDSSSRKVDLSAAPARTSKTLLGVGSFAARKVGYPETGGEGFKPSNGKSIYYAGKNESYIYRVNFSGDGPKGPFAVAEPENGVNAIAGPADIDGDKENELVFADGSQAVRYVSKTDPIEDTFPKAYDGAGSNNNVGIGRPADFNGDEKTASVPIVDGRNQIRLVGPNGIRETLITGSDDEQAAKSALTPADVDEDGSLEVVYLENNNSPYHLKYVDNVGTTNDFKFLKNEQGQRILADSKRGVVSQLDNPSCSPNALTTPEPSTLFLLMGAFAGIGVTRKTRRIC